MLSTEPDKEWAGGRVSVKDNKNIQSLLSVYHAVIHMDYLRTRAPLIAQLVKYPPAMWETWVQSLHWEDPLEKGVAPHFSILAWRIPWTEKPGTLQSMESQRVRRD